MSDGSFVLKNYLGLHKADWVWDDRAILDRTWRMKTSIAGSTAIACLDSSKVRRTRVVVFEARKKREKIVSLWGQGIRMSSCPAIVETQPRLDW